MMEQRQLYNYYAFISYSSADKEWAKWLQKRLENYRLPAAVRKESIDIPKRLTPIFRDETDLSTGVLESVLRKELEASKYLIVLCSPNSAKSQWVNGEVKTFLELGRTEQIIPLVISGEPHAKDPAREAFPPALREMEQELIGISVEKFGRKEAFLRVVAALLGIRYDVLAMRDKKRSRRNRMLAGAAALIAAVGIGWGVWYNTPHSKYYSAYVTEHEIPEGVHELSRQERKAAELCYEITTQRGKVVRLRSVNSYGSTVKPLLTLATADAADISYAYDENGVLISVENRNLYGDVLSKGALTHSTSTNQIAVDYLVSGDSIDVSALDGDLSYSGNIEEDTNSEITREVNTYDERGYLLQTMYKRDNLGTPACDGSGVYGKSYEYNEQGLVTAVHNLDASGNLYPCRYGWSSMYLTYDEWGRVLSQTFCDVSGSIVRDSQGYATVCCAYDALGRVTAVWYLDEQGQPCLAVNGVHQYRMEHDDRGCRVSMSRYDTQGNPVYDDEGVYFEKMAYDQYGRACALQLLDTDMNPGFSKNVNCSGFTYVLDENGRDLEARVFDTTGAPMLMSDTGAYSYRVEYDDRGKPVVSMFFDAEGKLTISKNGFAVKKSIYDDAGKLIRLELLDDQEQPLRGSEGYAAAEHSYDVFGNITETVYLDANNEPCMKSDGFAYSLRSYEDGRLVSIVCYDEEHRPVINQYGFCERRFAYDAAGNQIRMSHYDTQGNPAMCDNEYSVLEKQYDAYGNVTQMKFLGTDMELTGNLLTPLIDMEYDSRGNMVYMAYGSNRPLPYETVTMEYDAYNRKIRETRTGVSETEKTELEGVVKVYTYDAFGNVLAEDAFGADGLPWMHEDAAAVTGMRYTYDAKGNKIAEARVHTDANGLETVLTQKRYEYDDQNRLTKGIFLDAAGGLRNNDAGYAVMLTGADDLGRTLWMEHYDKDGSPVLNDGEAFRMEYAYDSMSNIVEIRRYGTDGALLPISAEYYGHEVRTYNSMGQAVMAAYYDAEGNRYGYVENVYETAGDLQRQTYYYDNGDLLETNIQVFYVSNVTPKAEAAGMRLFDYVVQVGDWNYFASMERGTASFDAQQSASAAPGEVIVCRVNADQTALEFERLFLTDKEPFDFTCTMMQEGVYLLMQDEYSRWQSR